MATESMSDLVSSGEPRTAAPEELRRLAASAFRKEDGSLLPFDEQVENLALGRLGSSEVLVVTDDVTELGLPQLEPRPLVIDRNTIEKVEAKHGLTLADMQALPEWLRGHPLAFDSITVENALVVVADFRDRHDNRVIIPIHIDKEVGQRGHRIAVDDVASVYGKRNLEYQLANAAKLGKDIWVNERTSGWRVRTGLQLPPLASSRYVDECTRLPLASTDAENLVGEHDGPSDVSPTSARELETRDDGKGW